MRNSPSLFGVYPIQINATQHIAIAAGHNQAHRNKTTLLKQSQNISEIKSNRFVKQQREAEQHRLKNEQKQFVC